MKLILTVSGKDLSTFMEQWACRGGVARFHSSFSFVRKKNLIELKLKQEIPRGAPKFVVSYPIATLCAFSDTCIIKILCVHNTRKSEIIVGAYTGRNLAFID